MRKTGDVRSVTQRGIKRWREKEVGGVGRKRKRERERETGRTLRGGGEEVLLLTRR